MSYTTISNYDPMCQEFSPTVLKSVEVGHLCSQHKPIERWTHLWPQISLYISSPVLCRGKKDQWKSYSVYYGLSIKPCQYLIQEVIKHNIKKTWSMNAKEHYYCTVWRNVITVSSQMYSCRLTSSTQTSMQKSTKLREEKCRKWR